MLGELYDFCDFFLTLRKANQINISSGCKDRTDSLVKCYFACLIIARQEAVAFVPFDNTFALLCAGVVYDDVVQKIFVFVLASEDCNLLKIKLSALSHGSRDENCCRSLY